MNLSVPSGFLLAGVVIFYLLHDSVSNLSVILSKHAGAVVLGGTLAAAFICCRFSFLFEMAKVFWHTLTGRRQTLMISTLDEIVEFAGQVNDGTKLSEIAGKAKNFFLRELLVLSESAGLEGNQFDEVVRKRLEQQNERYRRDAYLFKTIGKFPPAFGLVGTTIGMISLLQGLGEQDAFSRIGPSMSIALVATFYGLVLANFFLIPIGENLHLASEEDLSMRRMVVDGVRLLREKRHPLMVKDYLMSYLPPKDRHKLKGTTGDDATAQAA